MAGLTEAINGARNSGAPLHIVHINSSGGDSSAQYIQAIESAVQEGLDVSTEAYPYEAGMTRIESSLFDGWESWSDERIATHQWAQTGEFLNRESFGQYRQQGGGVIIHSRTEAMTEAALNSDLTMIASDGFLQEGMGHPRTSGTYSKVLGKYVREQKLYTLMDALRRMTIAPARRLENYVPAMRKKGRIKTGADADLTLFNPNTIIDRATYTDPDLPSEGVEYVLIDGKLVVENGSLIPDAKYGQAIRKE
jgi:dihydroorotase